VYSVPSTSFKGIRIPTVAAGVTVLVLCAAAAFQVALLCQASSSEPGRASLVVVFAILTASTVLIVGTIWMNRVQASRMESVGALVCAELITWSMVTFFAGEWWGTGAFLFWASGSLIFAPSWLLAWHVGPGRAAPRR
jgi:hypothetical protein